MQAHDLKYKLLDKLISIKDDNVLQEIDKLIGAVDLEKTVIKVIAGQKEMLINSEEDICNERLILNEDLNEEEDQWLNE